MFDLDQVAIVRGHMRQNDGSGVAAAGTQYNAAREYGICSERASKLSMCAENTQRR